MTIEEVREEKLAKLQAHEFEAAADLRYRELQLVHELSVFEEHWLDDALTELRRRLGLPGS